jgi:hypothetical protein
MRDACAGLGVACGRLHAWPRTGCRAEDGMQTRTGCMRGHAQGHRAEDCMRTEDGAGARLWSTLAS